VQFSSGALTRIIAVTGKSFKELLKSKLDATPGDDAGVLHSANPLGYGRGGGGLTPHPLYLRRTLLP